MKHFNPRSPRGERRSCSRWLCSALNISIHAPRGGSDDMAVKDFLAAGIFQSTLPAGGATGKQTIGLLSHTTFQSTLPAGGATKNLQGGRD